MTLSCWTFLRRALAELSALTARAALAAGVTVCAVAPQAPAAAAPGATAPASADADTGPSLPWRVGRLSLLGGSVDAVFEPSAAWQPAPLNAPLSSGTSLRVGPQSRAEVRLGRTTLHLSGNSQVSVDTLDDRSLLLNLQRGAVALTVRSLAAGEIVSLRVGVVADGAVVSVAEPGSFRFAYMPAQQRLEVRVFEGSLVLPGKASAVAMTANQQAVWDVRSQSLGPVTEAERSRFDDWAAQRARRSDRPGMGRFVSVDMTGAEDLDEHGRWRMEPRIGPVWYPNAVDAEWAPYREGRWLWQPPWGWAWVDDSAWGFAPFHHGRWLFLSGRWGWVPGPLLVRPAYAPALVGFYGNANPSQDWVGWFPLAPGEPYRPGFFASATTLQAFNASVPDKALATPVHQPFNHRYAQTSFAATALNKDAFATALSPALSASSAAALRVPLSPATLTSASVLARHAAPMPGPGPGPGPGSGSGPGLGPGSGPGSVTGSLPTTPTPSRAEPVSGFSPAARKVMPAQPRRDLPPAQTGAHAKPAASAP